MKELRLSIVELEKLGVSLVLPQYKCAEAEENARRVVAALNLLPEAKPVNHNDQHKQNDAGR